MKRNLNGPEKRKLTETISSYLGKYFKEIVAAYLYGSFVTNLFFSDIDLGILTKNDFERTLNFELDLENKLEKI